jgi:Holliday junction DNA helicase RuvA
MYSYIKGIITEIATGMIIIETGGIGYEINASLDCQSKISLGESATIHTYCLVKEDSHTLYGFANPAERSLFLQLLGISGVGAKSAIAMLSIGSTSLLKAISNEDVSQISTIKGVSRKTAEKVILELRGKLPAGLTNTETDDAVSGLVNLGLGITEARSIIKSINTLGLTAEQIIEIALKARRV